MPGNPRTYVDTLNSFPAYSNACSGPIGCFDQNYKWECVEFVQRYYANRFNLSLGPIPEAWQTIEKLRSNPKFVTYLQGSTTMPKAEDIIVFGKNAVTLYGHVAIAKCDPSLQPDGTYQIPIIEQNSYLTHILTIQGDSASGFKITGRLGLKNTAPIIGWVRRATPGVTYTYTGKPFTTFYGSPGVTSSNFVSASLTFPCILPANLPGFVINLDPPMQWSITDGVHTITSATPGAQLIPGGWLFGFDLGTDSTGRIVEWGIVATTAPLFEGLAIFTSTIFGADVTMNPSYNNAAFFSPSVPLPGNFGVWSGPSGTSTCTGPVSLGAFDAGGWSGNNYVYDWFPFSPSAPGKLAGITTDLFSCANGNCNGCDANGDNCGSASPAFYAVCGVNAGKYNSCPAGSLLATSDPSTGVLYGAFTFSGANQVTLNAGQTYWVRPYICNFGLDSCVGGQALAGGVQSFFGFTPK
jgi:hypothetical protein